VLDPPPAGPERPAHALVGVLRTDARAALALVAGCLVLYLPLLACADLWESGDARYAEVAREMAEGGDWLVPHLNGEVYPDKPPLYFWAAAATAKALGEVSEFAVRLPSALASTALVLLTFFLGRRLFDRRAGFFAGAVLATSHLFLERAIHAALDPLLALCIAGSLAIHERARGAWRPAAALALGALSGLATLTKGPVVGLLLPVAILAAMAWLDRRGGRRSLPALHGVLALSVAVAIPLVWFLLAWRRPEGGLTLEESVGRQALGRVLAPWNHDQPPWYFLLAFPVDFLPWTPFLALAAPYVRRPSARDRDGVRFAATWLLATVVFFSLGPSKRHVYLLPAFPAAALLTGLAVARACEGGLPARAWATAAAATGPVLVLLGLATAAVSPFLPRIDADAMPEWGLAVGALLVVAGIAARAIFRRSGLPGFCLAFPALLSVATLLAGVFLLPRLDTVKSARPLSERIRTLTPPEPVLFFDVRPDAYSFYTRMRLRETKDRDEFVRDLSSEPDAVGVTTRRWFEALRPRLPSEVGILFEDRVGRRRVVLLGRPAS